ncbi:MAG: hypothetical protein JW751_26420 [Polyangiaceae bacterium]|nr:hypothetical protein [Polyangiaceae bacterium]
MRNVVFLLAVAGLASSLALTGCKKKEQPAATYPYGQPTAQPGYGAPTAQPTATTPPATAPAPTLAPAAVSTLSTPGPLAPPCTMDTQCLTAKCHPTFQKCILPCTMNDDCISPNVCVAGVCAPNLAAPVTGTP